MDGFLNQIQDLDATDLADILRNVQSGTLTLQEEQAKPNTGTNTLQQSHIPENVVYAVDDHDNADDVVAALGNDYLSDPDVLAPSHRFISLRRPGRSISLQSNDSDVDVPLSKKELQKQIFATRRMGAPAEIGDKISLKAAGLGSPSKIKPNIGQCRSVSRPPQLGLNGGDRQYNEKLDHQLQSSVEYSSQRSNENSVNLMSSTENLSFTIHNSRYIGDEHVQSSVNIATPLNRRYTDDGNELGQYCDEKEDETNYSLGYQMNDDDLLDYMRQYESENSPRGTPKTNEDKRYDHTDSDSSSRMRPSTSRASSSSRCRDDNSRERSYHRQDNRTRRNDSRTEGSRSGSRSRENSERRQYHGTTADSPNHSQKSSERRQSREKNVDRLFSASERSSERTENSKRQRSIEKNYERKAGSERSYDRSKKSDKRQSVDTNVDRKPSSERSENSERREPLDKNEDRKAAHERSYHRSRSPVTKSRNQDRFNRHGSPRSSESQKQGHKKSPNRTDPSPKRNRSNNSQDSMKNRMSPKERRTLDRKSDLDSERSWDRIRSACNMFKSTSQDDGNISPGTKQSCEDTSDRKSASEKSYGRSETSERRQSDLDRKTAVEGSRSPVTKSRSESREWFHKRSPGTDLTPKQNSTEDHTRSRSPNERTESSLNKLVNTSLDDRAMSPKSTESCENVLDTCSRSPDGTDLTQNRHDRERRRLRGGRHARRRSRSPPHKSRNHNQDDSNMRLVSYRKLDSNDESYPDRSTVEDRSPERLSRNQRPKQRRRESQPDQSTLEDRSPERLSRNQRSKQRRRESQPDQSTLEDRSPERLSRNQRYKRRQQRESQPDQSTLEDRSPERLSRTQRRNHKRRETRRKNRIAQEKEDSKTEDGLDGYLKRTSGDKLNESTHPEEITEETSNSKEEIVPAVVIEEEPMPNVVHSQVDKQAATCSFESLSTFKIPKKAKAPKPATTDEIDTTEPPQDTHKRGAAHEEINIVQRWSGVAELKSGGDRVMKRVRSITGTESNLGNNAQKLITTGEWYDDMNNVRSVLPEIPEAHLFLSGTECKEVQQVLKAYCADKLNVRKKKNEYDRHKKIVLKTKSRYVGKKMQSSSTTEDWIKNQTKLFKQINLDELLRAIKHKELFKLSASNKCMFCYLCQVVSTNYKEYNLHMETKGHFENIARALTTVGREFMIKYLKNVAKKNKISMTKELEKCNKSNLPTCEVCKKQYKRSLKRHLKSQEHKDAVEQLTVRPRCDVCDIVFNTVKDQRHHMTRGFHKRNLERKIEYGELPADYKDPVSSQDEADKEQTDDTQDAAAALSDDDGAQDYLMDHVDDDLSSDDKVQACPANKMDNYNSDSSESSTSIEQVIEYTGEHDCRVCKLTLENPNTRLKHISEASHNVTVLYQKEYSILPPDYVDENDKEMASQRNTDFIEDRDKLICLGQCLMSDTQGFFCVPCGLFQPKTCEPIMIMRLKHMKEEGHQRNLKVYKRKRRKKERREHSILDDSKVPTDTKRKKRSGRNKSVDVSGVMDDSEATPKTKRKKSGDVGGVMDDSEATPKTKREKSVDDGGILDDSEATPKTKREKSVDVGGVLDDSEATPKTKKKRSKDVHSGVRYDYKPGPKSKKKKRYDVADSLCELEAPPITKMKKGDSDEALSDSEINTQGINLVKCSVVLRRLSETELLKYSLMKEEGMDEDLPNPKSNKDTTERKNNSKTEPKTVNSDEAAVKLDGERERAGQTESSASTDGLIGKALPHSSSVVIDDELANRDQTTTSTDAKRKKKSANGNKKIALIVSTKGKLNLQGKLSKVVQQESGTHKKDSRHSSTSSSSSQEAITMDVQSEGNERSKDDLGLSVLVDGQCARTRFYRKSLKELKCDLGSQDDL